ncbi:hypothetical protein JT623_001616 [Escherichia coli]|nr:hypothetical protein [Escherichia coli]
MARPPKAPAYLDEIAVRQWKEKSRQLSGREDLTPADWSNLELYCVNYSIYRRRSQQRRESAKNTYQWKKPERLRR